MSETKVQGLCHRCDWRARFKEDGTGPRSECKSDMAVRSCYMYTPTKPLWQKPSDGEKRPILGPALLSGRSIADGIGDTFGFAVRKDGAIMVIPGPLLKDCKSIVFVGIEGDMTKELKMKSVTRKTPKEEPTKKRAPRKKTK